jgi:hypothetical protein
MPRFSDRLEAFYRSLPPQGENVATSLRDALAARGRPQPIIINVTLPEPEETPPCIQ